MYLNRNVVVELRDGRHGTIMSSDELTARIHFCSPVVENLTIPRAEIADVILGERHGCRIPNYLHEKYKGKHKAWGLARFNEA